MEITERYRRSLKRKNYSAHTIKNYMNRIDHFTLWLHVPIEKTTRREIGAYVDHLLLIFNTCTGIHFPNPL